MLLHVSDEPTHRAGAQPAGSLRGQKVLGEFKLSSFQVFHFSTQMSSFLKYFFGVPISATFIFRYFFRVCISCVTCVITSSKRSSKIREIRLSTKLFFAFFDEVSFDVLTPSQTQENGNSRQK